MDINKLKEELQGLTKGQIRTLEPMSRHTTWRIGGPADLFLQIIDMKDLEKALKFTQDKKIPVTLIGGGSNLLVHDQGIRGLVIKTAGVFNKVEFFDKGLKAEAGVSLPLLAIRSAQNSLSGLEFAAGIPGTIGGAVIMNAGAHQGSMDQIIDKVTVMDRMGQIQDFTKNQLEFKYRSSKLLNSQFIVIEVCLNLEKVHREEVLKKIHVHKMFRDKRQPRKYPNAGSVFKNPPGDSAGRLIESAGVKGLQVGKAMVSEQHANFIINLGGATSRDISGLMIKVQEAVQKKYGITLEPEIIFLGG